MKNSRTWIKIIVTVLPVLFVCGFLPPDAEHRSSEILQTRHRRRVEYEQRMTDRPRLIAERTKQLRREMQHPPWRRSEEAMTAAENGGAAVRASVFNQEKRRHGWLAGFLGLFSIGGVALWIKRMTHEADNR